MTDQEVERLQKKAKTRYLLMAIFALAVLVVTAAAIFFFAVGIGDDLTEWVGVLIVGPVFLALGAGALFYLLFVQRAYQQFKSAFQTKYVLPTIESTGYFQNLSYQPKGGMSFNEIRDGGVVACGEAKYYHTEDLLTGRYGEIEFRYCDVETKYLARRGKKREVRTIFEGQVIRFATFNQTKWSFGHLQIFEKEFLSDLKGWTAPHKIETENEAFNKRFQVFAADPHNAFYILTPRMLEQITRFADHVGEQIAITFTGPILYVAICRSRSMFSTYVDEPISRQRQEILNDVELLRKAGDLLILELDVSGELRN